MSRDRNKYTFLLAFIVVFGLCITGCVTNKKEESKPSKTEQKNDNDTNDNKDNNKKEESDDASNEDEVVDKTLPENTPEVEGEVQVAQSTNQEFDQSQGSMIQVVEHRLCVPSTTQENGYYCGPASLQMVLNYHGIYVSQSQLASDLNTSSITGTEYLDMARVANKYIFYNEDANPSGSGYHVQTIAPGDSNLALYEQFEQRVRQDISTNDPVFVAVNVKTLYPQLFNANHLVVCTGYATYQGTDNIAYDYIMDPSYLVQDGPTGALHVVPSDILFEAIYSNEEPAYIW